MVAVAVSVRIIQQPPPCFTISKFSITHCILYLHVGTSLYTQCLKEIYTCSLKLLHRIWTREKFWPQNVLKLLYNQAILHVCIGLVLCAFCLEVSLPLGAHHFHSKWTGQCFPNIESLCVHVLYVCNRYHSRKDGVLKCNWLQAICSRPWSLPTMNGGYLFVPTSCELACVESLNAVPCV